MLLVDIGNTRTKYIQADRLGSDTPTAMLNSELSEYWLEKNWQSHKDIYLVCVGHTPLASLLQTWCDKHGIELTQIISEQSRFGLTTFYQQPNQLGADRWLALLGAKKLYPKQNILIVDSGTATTIDCLKANGQHKGGWILPGIDMMFSCLLTDTANVKGEQQLAAQLAFGANSSENVNSASWAATLGLIDESIQQAKIIDCEPEVVIILGGNGKQLFSLITDSKRSKSIKSEYCKVLLSEDLVFFGLKKYTK